MAEVDQAVVDEILAKAAEDTEEGRLEKLEREVETLKGSIKRLLLDIRETMNKLENPFVNLQSLAEANIVPQSAPQIQIVPTSLPKVEEKEEEKEEEEGEKTAQEVEEEKPAMSPGDIVKKTAMEAKKAEVISPKPVPAVKKEALPLMESSRMEFMTLFNLMEWVQGMVSKHSYESFKLMLEVFEMTGHLSSKAKELIMKLAELVKLNGAKEVLIELYMLNKVFNPNDRSLDSDMLSVLLGKR